MVLRIIRLSVVLALSISIAAGQGKLHLKTRVVDTGTSHAAHVMEATSPTELGGGHLLLQFDEAPTPSTVTELGRRGVRVLGDVPENGLLVAVPRRVSLAGLNVHFTSSVAPADKISPLIHPQAPTGAFYLVEFHADVDMNRARWVVLAAGSELRDNPDLQSHQLLVKIPQERLRWTLLRLVSRDEIAYVFPASDELINGISVRPCEGALTANGTMAQLIQTYGDGWDGPGLGAASLAYVFTKLTPQLDPTATQNEIRRAMAEWSKAVKISWAQASNATGSKTVNILFGAGWHGDAYPFDATGGVLAHTFFPAPPNPEPIAGDMHLDEAEHWRIGSNTDLFSVTLHELGHALGLGHSDDPAAVMYPYYRIWAQLSNVDIASARTLYATQDSTIVVPPPNPPPPPPPPPAGDTTAPAVTITTPSTATYATSSSLLTLRGAASDNVGVYSVTWATNFAKAGPAVGTTSWSATVPLLIGMNAVTIKAIDAAGNMGSRTVVITRR